MGIKKIKKRLDHGDNKSDMMLSSLDYWLPDQAGGRIQT